MRRGRPHYDYDCCAPRTPPAGLLYLRPPSVHTHIHDRQRAHSGHGAQYTYKRARLYTFGGITRRPRRRPYTGVQQQPRARKYIHNDDGSSSKADHPLMRLPHYSSCSLSLSLPACLLASSCSVSTAVRPDGWRNDCCTHVSACFGASQPAVSQPSEQPRARPTPSRWATTPRQKGAPQRWENESDTSTFRLLCLPPICAAALRELAQIDVSAW
jgi:hypothetical protein